LDKKTLAKSARKYKINTDFRKIYRIKHIS